MQLNGGTAQVTWAGTVGSGNSLVLGSATADSLVDFQNALDLGGGTRTVYVQKNVNSTTDAAQISGVLSNGSLVKTGPGTLALAGNNIFTGGPERRRGHAAGGQ